MSDYCNWNHCDRLADLGYSPDLATLPTSGLCQRHYTKLSKAEPQSPELFRALRKLGHSATKIRRLFAKQMETLMASKSKSAKAGKGSKTRTRSKDTSPAASKPKKIGRSKGKTSDLSIREFWAQSLRQNMKVSANQRLTDVEIQQASAAEFPGRSAADFSVPANVRRIRREFNEGLWCEPNCVSFEFDAAGLIVPPSVRRDSKNVPNSNDYTDKKEQARLKEELTETAQSSYKLRH